MLSSLPKHVLPQLVSIPCCIWYSSKRCQSDNRVTAKYVKFKRQDRTSEAPQLITYVIQFKRVRIS